MEATSSHPAPLQAAATAAAAAVVADGESGSRAALVDEEDRGTSTTAAHVGKRADVDPSASRNAVEGALPSSAEQLATARFKIIDFGHANVRAFHR